MTSSSLYPNDGQMVFSDADNKQLYAGQPTAIYNVEPTLYGSALYTVPDGSRTVLTSIYVFAEHEVGNRNLLNVMIRNQADTQDLMLAKWFEIPRLNAIRIDTNIVMNQGDAIYAGGEYDSNAAVGDENQLNIILTGKEFAQ